MPYPEMMVKAMRDDVIRLGAKELRSVEQVDAELANPTGTQLIFINSVCGCAAGAARPALAMALSHSVVPDQVLTVFAGQDLDATARVRSYVSEYQPSSPSAILLRDGEVVHFVHRHMIEGQNPEAIAADLIAAFDRHCSPTMAA
jgi:putative YphP/YqiW family bacilliredoxin